MKLRVVEALQQDVSYGRIRVPGNARTEMNLSPGDIVSIKGEKETAAVVWRSHPGDDDKDIIHVDNLIRKNAGVAVGDYVEVTKIDIAHLKEAVFSPAIGEEQQVQFGDGIELLVRRGLLKRPLHVGDILTVPNIALYGNALPFRVVSLSNSHGTTTVGRVTEETRIVVKDHKVDKPEAPKRNVATFSPPFIMEGVMDWAMKHGSTAIDEGRTDDAVNLVKIAHHADEILKIMATMEFE